MSVLRNFMKRFLANGAVARCLAEGERLLRGDRIDTPQREYARQVIERCLHSPAWEVRNVGVKLIPKLGDPAFYPRLVERLSDPKESGIVRRNAATAIGTARYWDDDARCAVASALRARYWEIRTEALHTLAALSTPSEDAEAVVLTALFGDGAVDGGRIRERNFEVRAACAQALGMLAVSDRGFAALCRLTGDRSWIVRYQATVAMGELAARLEHFRGPVTQQIASVTITPECSVSEHPFREQVARLAVELASGEHDGQPGEVRPMYLDLRRGWNVVDRE